MTYDPLLLALVDRLPRTDEPFPTGDRERWVAAMDAALQFLYPPEWTPEARRRAREARNGQAAPVAPAVDEDPMVTPEAVANAAIVLVKAREEAKASRTEADEPASPPSPEPVDRPEPRFGVCPTCDHRGRLNEDGTMVDHLCTPAEIPTRRKYTQAEKESAVRDVVRDGRAATSRALGIHSSVLTRWMGEMPDVVAQAKAEMVEGPEQREQVVEDDATLLAALEAEKARPVPPPKPAVQWPSTPIERRPVDPDRVRQSQAGAG